MRICIVNGSPLRDGNTEEVLKPFRRRLAELGAEVDDIHLDDYKLEPCVDCHACQEVQDGFGCVIEDDAEALWRRIGEAELLVLATPIFTWYCTPSMKILMDRSYPLNKYYRSATGQLIPKLSIALITTHGYEDDFANGPFETGVKRWCWHSHWDYAGRYSVRDVDGLPDMQTPEAVAGAERFAEELMEHMHVSRETL